MNILYIHGFAAKFDVNSTKVSALFELGTVFGMTIDYTEEIESIIKQLSKLVAEHNIDLIVGSSLGGYYASLLGNVWSIPFVAINPAIEPQLSLKQYIGDNEDWNGNKYHLKEDTVNSYSDFLKTGRGIIFLDMGDTVLNPIRTMNRLIPYFDISAFEDGSHRFEHMEEALPIIENFYRVVNGSD